jgi:hypothetical protein
MHQGASKIRQRARISVYWPGIDAEILNAASQCEECAARLPSQQKEIIRHREKATRPFEFIHADIGEDNGRHFLVIVDHFSGWPHFKMFQDKSTSAARLIDEFRNFFTAIGGAPVKLWSDNSIFPSPHYPQSNGRAGAGIKAIKALVTGSRTGGSFDKNKMARRCYCTATPPV